MNQTRQVGWTLMLSAAAMASVAIGCSGATRESALGQNVGQDGGSDTNAANLGSSDSGTLDGSADVVPRATDGGALAVCLGTTRYCPVPTSAAAEDADVLASPSCACEDEPPCVTTCGLMNFGHRTCTCIDGLYDCERTCIYDYGARDYSCYQLPASPPPLCLPDPTDNSVGGSPMVGSACTAEPCLPCGPEFLDSTGAPKLGYCVCEAQVWQCAAANVWPP